MLSQRRRRADELRTSTKRQETKTELESIKSEMNTFIEVKNLLEGNNSGVDEAEIWKMRQKSSNQNNKNKKESKK